MSYSKISALFKCILCHRSCHSLDTSEFTLILNVNLRTSIVFFQLTTGFLFRLPSLLISLEAHSKILFIMIKITTFIYLLTTIQISCNSKTAGLIFYSTRMSVYLLLCPSLLDQLWDEFKWSNIYIYN